MELFIEKESLQNLNNNLEKEILELQKDINNYYKEIELIPTCWKGDRYDLLMNEIEKNKKNIQESYLILNQYKDLIQKYLNNYMSLQEGIKYNES